MPAISLSCTPAQVLPYMMKWLWEQVPIQQDLLQGRVPHLEHAKNKTLASALNYHRGGSTGFWEANAYLLINSWDNGRTRTGAITTEMPSSPPRTPSLWPRASMRTGIGLGWLCSLFDALTWG